MYLDKNILIHFIIIVFIIGLSYHAGKFLFDTSSLLSLLRKSTRLRKIGNAEILISDQAFVPFATRLFYRAQVMIPIHFLESRRNLKIAILHELQHHRNQDTVWI